MSPEMPRSALPGAPKEYPPEGKFCQTETQVDKEGGMPGGLSSEKMVRLFSGPHHLPGSRRCEQAWREAWIRFRSTGEGVGGGTRLCGFYYFTCVH